LSEMCILFKHSGHNGVFSLNISDICWWISALGTPPAIRNLMMQHCTITIYLLHCYFG
jgi:hypothetical protein